MAGWWRLQGEWHLHSFQVMCHNFRFLKWTPRRWWALSPSYFAGLLIIMEYLEMPIVYRGSRLLLQCEFPSAYIVFVLVVIIMQQLPWPLGNTQLVMNVVSLGNVQLAFCLECDTLRTFSLHVYSFFSIVNFLVLTLPLCDEMQVQWPINSLLVLTLLRIISLILESGPVCYSKD